MKANASSPGLSHTVRLDWATEYLVSRSLFRFLFYTNWNGSALFANVFVLSIVLHLIVYINSIVYQLIHQFKLLASWIQRIKNYHFAFSGVFPDFVDRCCMYIGSVHWHRLVYDGHERWR